MNLIASIVVTFHPDDAALRAICALASQTSHVIVVDNTAEVETTTKLQRIQASAPNIFILLSNSENFGVAAALNRGMRYAQKLSAEWALTLDQDSRATVGMVDALLATRQAFSEPFRPRVALLAPSIVDRQTKAVSDPTIRTFKEVSTAITSGNLINVSAWQDVGGYDERLFIDYVDHDFCFRLRRAGFRIAVCDGAVLQHTIGDARQIRPLGYTVTVDQHSPLRYYYMTRNGFYFWKTYACKDPFLRADKLNALKLLVKATILDTRRIERLRMFWRGYRDYRAGRFGRYSPPPN